MLVLLDHVTPAGVARALRSHVVRKARDLAATAACSTQRAQSSALSGSADSACFYPRHKHLDPRVFSFAQQDTVGERIPEFTTLRRFTLRLSSPTTQFLGVSEVLRAARTLFVVDQRRSADEANCYPV